MNTRIEPEVNFIADLSDSYKDGHFRMIERGTQASFSFFESRGGVYPTVTFFGLQYYLKRYLLGQVVNQTMLEEAKLDVHIHFNQPGMINEKGWQRIITEHNGNLPIRICAVPEGTTVPVGHVLMTIETTDEQIPEIGQFEETLLSMIWYPCTVATQSRAMRATIMEELEATGDPSLIDFKLHDFGFRGSTSVESAGIGGMAHLLNFKGSDTKIANRYARTYYGEPMAGYSVPAAEHFTITSWGRNREADAYRAILKEFPSGFVSIVADSWDIYHACREIFGKQLKDLILERDGVLVVRPDSGYPPEVVVKVLTILGEAFGTRLNTKGYKVLNDKVRVIQGDGIDHAMIVKIYEATRAAGWSADNLTYGSGGGLLQKVNRDTQKFAFKCSATRKNGQWEGVMKDPVTDPGKKSKAGRLALIRTESGFQTIQLEQLEMNGYQNLLRPVFENGRLLVDQSFAEIRERALAA